MTIREELIETYPEDTFLFADGFDEAIIGVDKNMIVCYDQDKCIDILAKDMTPEEADEYFWYNTAGAHMGEKTPIFIKRFNNAMEPDIDLDVSAEHQARLIYESPDGGDTIYKRKFGEYDSKEVVFGEGEGHD